MLLELAKARYDLIPASQGDFLILCPFHDESKPSCRVNDKRYKCFSCGAFGDAISWLRKLEGKSFKEAYAIVNGHSNIPAPKKVRPVSQVNFSPEYLEILKALDIYVKSGEQYFTHRVSKQDAINHALRINCKLDDIAPDIAVKAGIAVQMPSGQLVNRHAGRVVIPIKNSAGIVVAITSRDITNAPNALRYLDSTNTACYKKSRVLHGLSTYIQDDIKAESGTHPLWVMEGLFDAMCTQHACALAGCVISPEQANLIVHFSKNVIVALDADKAGRAASFSVAQKLLDAGLPRVRIAWLSAKYKDWNELYMDISLSNLLLYNQEDVYGASWSELSCFTKVIKFDKLKVTMSPSKQYDTSLLIEMSQRLVDKNIEQGYPHFNLVDYAMACYPELAKEVRAARDEMMSKAVLNEATQKYVLGRNEINKFLLAWAKICKQVRKDNNEQKEDK